MSDLAINCEYEIAQKSLRCWSSQKNAYHGKPILVCMGVLLQFISLHRLNGTT